MPEIKSDESQAVVRAETKSASSTVPDSRGLPIPSYANHVQVVATLLDIKLEFGIIMKVDQETDTATLANTASVLMTPELAKVLYVTLQTTLRRYEEQLGKIRILPDHAV